MGRRSLGGNGCFEDVRICHVSSEHLCMLRAGDLLCELAHARSNAEGVASSSPGLNRDSGATLGNGCEHQPRSGLNPLRATTWLNPFRIVHASSLPRVALLHRATLRATLFNAFGVGRHSSDTNLRRFRIVYKRQPKRAGKPVLCSQGCWRTGAGCWWPCD